MARRTKEEAGRTREQIIDAARVVFHEHGVSRSTLEQVAQTAGLTRGAVYWHFNNKAELFHAMREDAFVPMRERIDAILFSEEYENPLDAIEAALQELFRILKDEPVLRQVFEIMVLRCEYVGEFAEVLVEANRPATDFQEKVEKVYQKASAKRMLRTGLDPSSLARDTWAFASGLLQAVLDGRFEKRRQNEIAAMISIHMGLRKRERAN